MIINKKIINNIYEKLTLLETKISYLEGIEEYNRAKSMNSNLSGKGIVTNNYEESIKYWTKHNVTNSIEFKTPDDSIDYLNYRNDQYPGYIDLMPQTGKDGKVVVDYGCGPGNDLVGFSIYSKPTKLFGFDVSSTALDLAKKRLELHSSSAELIQINSKDYVIPINDSSVDYIHCSGVLMLIPDPLFTLKEFQRILKPGGELRLMVYNKDSIWFHLYVAYIIKIENGLYPDLSLKEIFSLSTDGEDCPINQLWSPREFINLASKANFNCEFIGAAISLWEQNIVNRRFRALMDTSLNSESREFLKKIIVNEFGIPHYNGNVAGIDACFTCTHV